MNLLTSKMPHQSEAIEKLGKLQVGALFMEMGTGKTRVALELAYMRLKENKVDAILWLCPNSVILNLKLDILKHSQGMASKISICGIQTLSGSTNKFLDLYGKLKSKRYFLIVDESNLVKNHRAIRSERIVELSKLCTYKLILNGTPISKNEADLYNQMYILSPKILGFYSYSSFFNEHVVWDDIKKRIDHIANLDRLHARIAPFAHQVLKSDCLDLPEKKYREASCLLTKEQANHYQDVLLDLQLDQMGDELNKALAYRRITAERLMVSGRRLTEWSSLENLKHEPFFENPKDNPRIDLLMELLNEIGKEKVIIWIAHTHAIKDIAGLLGDKAVMYYGEMSSKEREEAVEAFRCDKQYFLANKACGGYGLNLQFCHHVIYYENDYDFAIRNQSEDRTHRIGQDKEVQYIDICTIGTIDEHILEVLEKKESKLEDLRDGIEAKKRLEAIYFKEKGVTGGEKVSK